MGWDDDEAEREMERARRADARRSSGPVAMGAMLQMRGGGRAGGVPPQVTAVEKLLTCFSCGFASSTHRGWSIDPLMTWSGNRARGVVCSARFDETGARIDCYERLETEATKRRTEEVEETRLRIRAANERKHRGPGMRGGFEP